VTVTHPANPHGPPVSARRRAIEITVGLRTLLLVAAVAGIAVALVSIRDALLLAFTGIFLALVFEIPTRLCTRWLKVSRNIAAAIVVLGSVVILTILALVLLVPMVDSLVDFLKGLPQTVEDLRNSNELSWLGDSGGAKNVQQGSEHLANTIPSAVGAFLGIAGSAFSVGLSLFTIIFIALFLLMDLPRLQAALASVLPSGSAARSEMLWERITVTVSRWALGAGFIAVIAGTVQGGAAWILGASPALALGLIAGFLDLIPTIGATIAGFILVPTVLAQQGLTAALIMLAVILVYQQIENNVLTPTVQGKAVNISGFFVMLGVTIFGALLGVIGALVSVPVTASIQIVLGELTADRRARLAAAKAAEQGEVEAVADGPVTQPAAPGPA
jgi:predicted PurR-regulated permease PerM